MRGPVRHRETPGVIPAPDRPLGFRALTRIGLVRRDQLDAGRDVSGYLGQRDRNRFNIRQLTDVLLCNLQQYFSRNRRLGASAWLGCFPGAARSGQRDPDQLEPARRT